MVQHNPEVDRWFEGYTNPQKELMLAVRDVILGVDPRMTEAIKWKAPTFMYRGNMASFFPRAVKHVVLMFHTGASLSDPQGILGGEGDVARSAKVLSFEDLAEKTPGLEAVTRSWIEHRDGV
ncbi:MULTISPECIES: DUF1801 domain-containing protein [Arthrobacter]|uniref:DUF1801 domain-containing protein n=2 Tax=Arthrobacter TaxID=1663 RepID=A0ABU9KN08_9MICC|nr:DUF1801 domain-containing protein [Arthrobacter sp. YJM1]MDP5228239.1 DUF1801 domain-containing protein [Arthrobacter sp. YJM1]